MRWTWWPNWRANSAETATAAGPSGVPAASRSRHITAEKGQAMSQQGTVIDERIKQTSGLRKALIDFIEGQLCLRMNPHLFRHIMAYAYLNENPGAYQVLRLIFGHKSVETTVNSYSGAETKSAQAHFDKVIHDLREKHHAPLPKRQKR